MGDHHPSDTEKALEDVRRMKLVVVGGGPLASHYGSYMPESCRGRIEFTGFVSNEMLARHYATADVFCSPATGGESFGNDYGRLHDGTFPG